MKGPIYDFKEGPRPIYDAWLANADERDVLENLLSERLHEWCRANPLHMIDWGCGTGSAAKRFFRVLSAEGIDFDYTGVDPFPQQLARFAASTPQHQTIRFAEGSFQTFDPAGHYHLALAVHSLYYAGDLNAALSKMATTSDRMLLVYQGGEGVHKVRGRFSNWVQFEDRTKGTYEEVCASLEEHGIPYDLAIYPTQVNVRPCHDPTNEEGRDLVKFFLDDRDASQEKICAVSEYLSSFGDTMQHDMAVIITG